MKQLPFNFTFTAEADIDGEVKSIVIETGCECLHDCRACSKSGIEWHVHAGEDCTVHPEAPVS